MSGLARVYRFFLTRRKTVELQTKIRLGQASVTGNIDEWELMKKEEDKVEEGGPV